MSDAPGDKGTFPAAAVTPEQLTSNLVRAVEVGGQVIAKVVAGQQNRGGGKMVTEGFAEFAKLFTPVAEHWVADVEGFATAQARLSRDLVDLWARTSARFLGNTAEPLVQPASGDQRFRDNEWSANPFFDFLKQAYLITGSWAHDMIDKAGTLDQPAKRRAQFYLTQIEAALSPSNFPFTNPEVMKVTLSTGGENLVHGMSLLLEDLQSSGEMLRLRQTDMSAFEVGKNLAITPGKVVLQNDVMQLIQYAPSTSSVYEIPLLIIPPWINKYYILDLTPQKSFIKWLVDRGYTVFVVSWVNPGASLALKSFEDYMREGVFEAIDAVKRITNVSQVNALGYCVGGTLLACTLAYAAQVGDTQIRSASFLATQTDFSEAGDLLVFVGEEQLSAVNRMMSGSGYLDGSQMSVAFNMLRPRDLIWPYIVNNYLLDKAPFPFDLLFWNADSTRMPSANHSFYLREFYQHNRLSQGQLQLGGVTLDLKKVTVPVYELATREDHISPAQSVLTGAKLFGGPLRFVLAGSGHIAGVINAPGKPKYMHWVLEEESGPEIASVTSIDGFVAKAKEVNGSWWPDYDTWLARFSGPRVVPRLPGAGPLPALEDAPGSYVRVKA